MSNRTKLFWTNVFIAVAATIAVYNLVSVVLKRSHDPNIGPCLIRSTPDGSDMSISNCAIEVVKGAPQGEVRYHLGSTDGSSPVSIAIDRANVDILDSPKAALRAGETLRSLEK